MNKYNTDLLKKSSPEKKISPSQPTESQIPLEDRKKLEKAFNSKKRELAQQEAIDHKEKENLKNKPRYRHKRAYQQMGFSGLKGKKSLNPRKNQLKSLSKLTKAQNTRLNASILQDNQDQQLRLNLDLKVEDRAVKRAVERATEKAWKKERKVYWIPRKDLEYIIYRLKQKKSPNGEIRPLTKRSREVWNWLYSLKANKFQKKHIPVPFEICKAVLKGYNRNQCTELFIAFLSMCLNQKSKIKYAFGGRYNFISHFGFNNSYSEMSWTSKQREFMQKIVSRLNTLNWVDIKEIIKKFHKKTKKVFYELVFNSLNKWSKELTEPQKKKTRSTVNKCYLKKGLAPPKPVSLLGLNLWPQKI